MAQAERVGAIEAGWIPDWIPGGATDIHEVHDLDTNESMLAFKLPADAPWPLPSHCRPVAHDEIGPPRFSRSWWPSPEELAGSYSFHRCAGDDPYTPKAQWVARHKSGRLCLHWRAYAHE